MIPSSPSRINITVPDETTLLAGAMSPDGIDFISLRDGERMPVRRAPVQGPIPNSRSEN